MNSSATDPVALTAALVRCHSVTPEEGGALQLLAQFLEPAGFRCRRADRNGIPNLHARIGTGSPVLGFGGHTDVVPTGPREAWTADPFGGEIRDGMLWGRGAVDMKSGVAAFAAAAVQHLHAGPPAGSISLLITGDEEGDATDGTPAILDWMRAEGETLDACIVGEPTSLEKVGDVIKIGRRGAISFRIRAEGTAGHSAYPDRARNPLPPLARLVADLAATELDTGTERFSPSTLAITSIDTGNPASNVIPGAAEAVLNIRFNDTHTGSSLTAWLESRIAEAAETSGLTFSIENAMANAEAFICEPGPFVGFLQEAVRSETGLEPELSTSGGTSDARFIKDLCPTAEIGLVGRTMHAADERVPVRDIETLANIYRVALDRYLPKG